MVAGSSRPQLRLQGIAKACLNERVGALGIIVPMWLSSSSLGLSSFSLVTHRGPHYQRVFWMRAPQGLL